MIESLRALPPLVRRWIRETESTPPRGAARAPDYTALVAALTAQARRRDRTLIALVLLAVGALGVLTDMGGYLSDAALVGACGYLLLRR